MGINHALKDFPLCPDDTDHWSYWDGNQNVLLERPPIKTEGIFYLSLTRTVDSTLWSLLTR